MIGPLKAFKPCGRRRRLVEDAAPQLAGGGVAPRVPAVNADEPRDAILNDGTMRESQAGLAITQQETVSGDIHPRIPALFAKMRPAAVIICPSQLLSGLYARWSASIRISR
jgi:hypothetical protein